MHSASIIISGGDCNKTSKRKKKKTGEITKTAKERKIMEEREGECVCVCVCVCVCERERDMTVGVVCSLGHVR